MRSDQRDPRIDARGDYARPLLTKGPSLMVLIMPALLGFRVHAGHHGKGPAAAYYHPARTAISFLAFQQDIRNHSITQQDEN